jgi:ABC-type transport system substrate-binding protein
MRSIRTRLDALAWTCAAAAATVLAAPLGCSDHLAAPVASAHGDDAPPRRGGTLRLADFQDIRNLDPAGPVDGLMLISGRLLFAGLVDYDDKARVVPDLAERWEVADGGRTYRFFLREHVTMHDGEELTADDVKRSVERALHPTSPGNLTSYYEGLVGFAAYAAGTAQHLDGVVVEGRYVVTFHLTDPDATFPYLMTLMPMRPVCKSAGDRYVDTWLPCGAGPFKLEADGWKRGTSLRVVRHDGYYVPGLPYLDAIESTLNMQVVSQALRFQDGDLDILSDISSADLARFQADPRWKPYGFARADRSVYGEFMNTRVAPFDNVEVRRAVAAAIDREQYRLVNPLHLRVATQLIPPNYFGYEPSFAGQRYDYAAALEHMRKAGYPYDPATDTGGWPRTVDYLAYDPSTGEQTVQVLQQQLAKIGIRLRVRLVSWTTYLALISAPGRATMGFGGWDGDFPDASNFFEPLFTSSAIGPETTDNYAFYSNPRFDDLVARAHHELDPGKRMTLYHEANAILCDDAPWAFTVGYHFYDVRQPYVHGFRPHPVWPMDVAGVWLDRATDGAARVLGGGVR